MFDFFFRSNRHDSLPSSERQTTKPHLGKQSIAFESLEGRLLLAGDAVDPAVEALVSINEQLAEAGLE